MAVVINGTTGVSGVAGSASTPALIGSDADSGYYINSANEPNASVNGTAVWSAASTFGFKNRIINGAMVIDQRNAGASVTPTNGAYTLDRYQSTASQASKYSVQQTTTAPSGFSYSLKATSLSAYTVGASESFRIQQPIEGYNIADLAWGTASAATVTLSFRVYSSLTGTFGGSITNAATDYTFPFSYTIPSANTWTTISVTITGPTSGTWGATNGAGLYVIFSLGAGSSVSNTAGAWASGFYASVTGATSVVGTNGATFYITGVQLEKGSTATSFDFRSYGTELALCQRYFESSNPTDQLAYMPFACYSSIEFYGTFMYKVTKRAVPSVTFNSTAWNVYYNSSARTFTSVSADGVGVNNMAVYIIGSGWAGGGAGFARNIAVNAIQLSAEL
jgi:hypothetical protein